MSATVLIRSLILPLILAVASCATSPFDDPAAQGVDRNVTYSQALTAPESVQNKLTVFGGTIIETRNLEQRTEITLLAYPLDSQDRPDLAQAPSGRIILVQPGYLEGTVYARGRLLSAIGRVDGLREAELGEATYTVLALRVEQLYLWPREEQRDGGFFPPWFNLGIGIGIGL